MEKNLSKDAREQRARAPNGYVRCHKDSFILEQTILARGENIAEEIDHQIHENDAIASGNGNLNESSTIQGLSPERLHTLRRRAECLTLRMSAQVSESMDESLYHAGLYGWITLFGHFSRIEFLFFPRKKIVYHIFRYRFILSSARLSVSSIIFRYNVRGCC